MSEETKVFEIKDPNDKVLYQASPEEMEEIFTTILSTGSYTKTFSLRKGKLELTFSTITDDERARTYEIVREYARSNEEASRLMVDQYTNKVNLAAQLVRYKINGNVINLQQGDLDERVKLLGELSEDLVRLCSKYLMIFAQLTYRAFDDQEVLENF